MRNRIVFVVALQLVLLLLVTDGTTRADSIGVNFTAEGGFSGGGPFNILPGESAGLVPQVNWNNTTPLEAGTTANIANPVAGVLVDDTGVDSGASITWLNGNGDTGSGGGTTTPDEKLFKGIVEGPVFKPPTAQLSVAMDNIPYATYDVYAYIARFPFDSSASARIGAQEFFYVQSTNFTADGFIKATATNVGDAQLATYAHFPYLTDNSFTLELIKQSGNRAAIAGLQVVRTPEPSTLSLGAMGLAACLALAWWRGRRRRRGF